METEYFKELQNIKEENKKLLQEIYKVCTQRSIAGFVDAETIIEMIEEKLN